MSNERARPEVRLGRTAPRRSGPANQCGYSQPDRDAELRAGGDVPVVERRAPDAAADRRLEGRPGPVAEQDAELLDRALRTERGGVASCGSARSTA